MYLQARSQREEYQRIILRKAEEVRRWVSENLDGTEERRIEFTHNGIGMMVFIRSIRAKELLVRLHQEVFSPGFSQAIPWLEDHGEWSVWFGYSEPLESPNYVRIQRDWNLPNPTR
jgi:hypothetical protein